MDCKRVESEQIAEKYVSGDMEEGERTAYEKHFFECTRCYEELRTYLAVQEALGQARGTVQMAPLRSKPAWRWIWVPVGVLAGLTLTAGVWFWQFATPTPGSPSEALLHQSSPAQPPPATVSLAEMMRIEPPPYAPTILRGLTEEEADRRFREAMKHYQQGDYDRALRGLNAAATLRPQGADIAFFLGACYLLTGQTNAATKELQRTVALGDTPFLEEAHFYLAKAYLRENNLPAAEKELRKALLLKGDLQGQIQDLLDQLGQLTQVPH